MPYDSPYTLPIPSSTVPTFLGAAPNISYPDVNNSALFAFAGGASTNFGLRFAGGAYESRTKLCSISQSLGRSAAHLHTCMGQIPPKPTDFSNYPPYTDVPEGKDPARWPRLL